MEIKTHTQVMPVYLTRVVTFTRLTAVLVMFKSTAFAIARTLDQRTYGSCRFHKQTLVAECNYLYTMRQNNHFD